MPSNRKIRTRNRRKPLASTPMEPLEQRQMLNAAVSVTVNTTQTLQTIEGLGAGIIPWEIRPEYTDPNFYNMIVDDLGATAVRAAVLPNAEKVNDNSDPNNLDLSKFDVNALAEPFDIFQQFQDRGVSTFVTSVWSAPAWMKTNNIYTDGGSLRPDMYGEFAEYLEAVAKIAKQDFGVSLYSISLQNEPYFVEPYESTTYNANQLVNTLIAVGRKFKADGITTKISVPEDLIDPTRMSWYIDAIEANPEAASYVGYFAGHALTGGWDQLRQLIAPTGKEFWQTETSGNSDSWSGAMGLATTILNSIDTADASGFLYWQFSDTAANSKFALMNAGVPNEKYYAAKQFYRYIRPGYVHVTDTSSLATLRAASYKDPVTGALTTVIVNSGTDDADVNFALTGSNLPGTYKIFRSSATEQMVSLGTITGGTNFNETIPANSIVTITNAPELPAVTGGAIAANTPVELTSSFVTQSQFWTNVEKGYDDNLIIEINDGANVNQVASNGWTPLITAAASSQGGSINTLNTLIADGANLNAVTTDGWTALTAAAANSFAKFGARVTLQTDKITALINAGLNVNQPDAEGRTPLIWAAMMGKVSGTVEDTSTVQLLLADGANPLLKDNAGMTAYDYAVQQGYTQTSFVLLKAMGTDHTPPTVAFANVTPNPRATSIPDLPINFSEPILGFDLSDVIVTRNGAVQTIPVGAALNSTDQTHYDLTNLGGLTSAPGTWVFTIKAATSGITDVSGNPLAADATESFLVTTNVPPPPPPPPTTTQSPFHGTPFDINASATTTIEFEDYDLGGEGVAYHDKDAANQGGAFRPTDGVDLKAVQGDTGGYYIGYTNAGEWTEYTVKVDTAGTYNLGIRYASAGAGGTFHLELDGTPITGELTAANTGGWSTWKTLSVPAVSLPAGQHILRLVEDTVGPTNAVANFNYLTVAPPTSPPVSPPPPPPPTTTQAPFGGTAPIVSTAPVIIQAENFDTGGEGVAYHDLDAANQGGAYRTTEGVDIQPTTDAGGGFNVGYTRASEWLEYTINVTTAGSYIIGARVASTAAGGKFHFEIDGTKVSSELSTPNTGGWQTYTNVNSAAVPLTVGQHVLRLALDTVAANGSVGNFNYITIAPPMSPPVSPPPPPPPPPPPTTTQTPFTGTAPLVGASPVTIQMENFDNGGEGVAYHDLDKANLGGSYRTTEGVDIQPTTDTGGGFNVGYAKAGEWIEYTINVQTAGNYDLSFRLASTGSNGKFHAEIDGTNVTGSLTVPNTGGYQTWQTLTKTGLPLSAGVHVLRISMDANSTNGSVGNFNYMTIAPSAPVPVTQAPFGGTAPVVGASSVTIQAENFDTGGEGVAYHDTDATNDGGAYRTTEGVDIEATGDTGGGFHVAYTNPGEWIEYTINVATAGTYTLDFRVASKGLGGKFHAEIDGANVTGALQVPDTTGWNTFQDVLKTGVQLTAGTHVLRLAFDSAGGSGFAGNFNWIKLTKTA